MEQGEPGGPELLRGAFLGIAAQASPVEARGPAVIRRHR